MDDDKEKLFIEVEERNDEAKATLNFPVNSLITSFVVAYCDCVNLPVVLAERAGTGISNKQFSFPAAALNKCRVSRCHYASVPRSVKQCCLPAIMSSDGTLVRSGLCGVLRRIVQIAIDKETNSQLEKLLVRHS